MMDEFCFIAVVHMVLDCDKTKIKQKQKMCSNLISVVWPVLERCVKKGKGAYSC